MQICFFEDDFSSAFLPLTYLKPVDQLRMGILTISEKWERHLQQSANHRIARSYLADVYKSQPVDSEQDVLLINSRFLPSDSIITAISALNHSNALYQDDELIALLVPGAGFNAIPDSPEKPLRLSSGRERLETEAIGIRHPWDIFSINGAQIRADLRVMNPPLMDQKNLPVGCIVSGDEPVYAEEGAELEPGVIIIADGPVYLGRKAKIMAGTVVRGPQAICDNAVVKMGSQLYADSTIGPWCKVGGELNNVVFQAYSNKGHGGFLGNSIIAEWCNLGAATNCSNLKNNYSNVRVYDIASDDYQDTGLTFCGTIMGPHTTAAIDTKLNTGSNIGMFCNIVADGFAPKHLPSFSWLAGNNTLTYDPQKAIVTARRMMARRKVEVSPEYEALILNLHSQLVG